MPDGGGRRAGRHASGGAGAQDPAPADERRFALAVTLLFAAVGLSALLAHEPWRDELQAWLIAAESRTLRELFRNLRYDGHPPLWYLLLYPLTRLTRDPTAMKLLHLALGTAAVYLFARFAPFTRLQRALFCFGYFPVYEYLAVSRNYAAGVLCLFAFCAAWRQAPARQRLLLLAYLLGLLANTSAYGFLLAWALALALLCDEWRRRRAGLEVPGKVEALLSLLVFLSLAALSARIMLPPPDGGNIVGWFLTPRLDWLAFTLSVVWRAFVPVPTYSYYLWNTNALRPDDLSTALLACLLLCATAYALARDRAALAAYAAGVGLILLFSYTKFYGSIRHHGHLYLLFVACLWLATARRRAQGAGAAPARRASRAGGPLFVALLSVHVAVAAIFLVMDWRHPFSRGRDAARFLRESGLEARYYLVADRDAHSSPLAAYLGRPIYYVRGAREGTYIVWDKTWGNWPLVDTMRADLPGAARAKARERREDVLAVATYPLAAPDAEFVGEVTGSIVGDEDYYFYLFRHRPPTTQYRER